MNDTAFELLPLHAVVEINPIPPETKVVPPSGALNTKTSTVPGCAMSVAVTVATNRRLLVNVVTRKELFQLTTESRRNSLPLMVSRNWLPPAVALLGESEVMDGADGQVPQDTAAASVIVSTTGTGNLALVAIGYAPRARWLTEREMHNGKGNARGSAAVAEPHNSSARCQDYMPDPQR